MNNSITFRFPAKNAATAVAVFMVAAMAAPTPALAQTEQSVSNGTSTKPLPAYYEDLCAKQIDLGNDGDAWMDALEECEKLAKRLKQLEKTKKDDAQRS